jgi:very-short-patch-repair endonuclease
LKGKALDGLKFRRQHSIENYIVDFYCPERKLVIEIDGPTHITMKAKSYDKIRTEVFRRYEIDELRIKNEEIYDNILLVLEKIEEKLI